ncbi:hypothetical protein [Photobacterium leiognathi]|uniref:hypothetical protein n=1 Tax=Photobacterium leiognathi TaxID=553611 RepID=UPI0029815FB1|nr:hypothetical protein [Photobacterium leiognathi]
MRKSNLTTFKGINIQEGFSDVWSVHCVARALDIVNILSFPELGIDSSEVCSILSVMTRQTNWSGVELKARAIINLIESGSIEPSIHIVGVLHDCSPQVKIISDDYVSISFPSNKIIIVEGIQNALAIMSLMGLPIPSITGKKTLSTVVKNTDTLDKIKDLKLLVSVLYKSDSTFQQEDIVNLFNKINNASAKINYVSLGITGDKIHPLQVFVGKLIDKIEIKHYGEVSLAQRLSKNDDCITTVSTLMALTLCAIGGKSARLTNPLPNKLPDKRIINEEIFQIVEPAITSFMHSWLKTIEPCLKSNVNSFLYSTQVWQAIGLVIHFLLKDHDPSSEIFHEAGIKIGKLNYDKSSMHWSQCKALKLDISGSHYINATGGGRTLRDGMAQYFISLMSL